MNEPLPYRRDYGAAIDRIERRLDECAAGIADLEVKQAAVEAILQRNGISSMVKEMHKTLAEHVGREDIMMQISREERAHLADTYRRLTSFILSVGGFVITSALAVIGYLFQLNFGD